MRVEWDREGFAETDLDGWVITAEAIERAKAELANRDLGRMLGPHHPSVMGIAAFFMERLRLTHPITKVEVHESDGPTGIIENDPDH